MSNERVFRPASASAPGSLTGREAGSDAGSLSSPTRGVIPMIVLFPDRGVWWAEFVGDPGTFEAFGTTVIETPFREAMPGPDVVDQLAALNEGWLVDYYASVTEWRADVAAFAKLGPEQPRVAAAMAVHEVTR
jgi:hypothetical protein